MKLRARDPRALFALAADRRVRCSSPSPSRSASDSTCGAAPRSCWRPAPPTDAEGRRRGHRPHPGGAARPHRRPRRRRTHPRPLRRAPDHRRTARRAGPAPGRRRPRPHRPAHLPPGPRPTAPAPTTGRTAPDTAGSGCSPTSRRSGCASAPAALTGEDVKDAAARFDPQSGAGWHVDLDFQGRRQGLGPADRRGRLPPGGRPAAPRRHRPRRQGHLLAPGRPLGGLRRRASPAVHADHRLLHRGRGQGPRPAHQRRRPARARGDRRAADRRPDARRRGHHGQRPGRRRSAPPLTALFIIVVYRLLGVLAAVALAATA